MNGFWYSVEPKDALREDALSASEEVFHFRVQKTSEDSCVKLAKGMRFIWSATPELVAEKPSVGKRLLTWPFLECKRIDYGGREMSKAVLISIRPKWCEKIASGEKTVEVRKTRPKLETPFKCYIYRTKAAVSHIINGKWAKMEVGGTVIGEFTCDRIHKIQKRGIPENFDYCYLSLNRWGNDDIAAEIKVISASCVSREELNAYGAATPFLYGWHISDLKIYDTPKELSEFWFPPEKYCDKELCGGCPYDQVADVNGEYGFDCEWRRPLSRPPQNWCYVEEQK